MIVLIDDERVFQVNRPNTITFKNCYDAMIFINENNPVIDELWLDHDLGELNDKPHDIFTIIDFIEEKFHFSDKPVSINKVIIHTANPIGGERINQAMRRMYPVIRVQAGDYLISE